MNDPTNDPDPLDALARRVADDAFFLAHALTAYQNRHGLDDAGLAAELGCAVAVLPSLRLCRTPGTADPDRTAAQDLADVCRRFGTDPAALARVVREAADHGGAMEGEPD